MLQTNTPALPSKNHFQLVQAFGSFIRVTLCAQKNMFWKFFNVLYFFLIFTSVLGLAKKEKKLEQSDFEYYLTSQIIKIIESFDRKL